MVTDDLPHRLGANLRALRAERGLTQEQLADMLGVYRTYLGGIERGERNLSLRSVERLACALGVEVDVLLSEVPALGLAGTIITSPASRSAPPTGCGGSGHCPP